MKTMSQAVTSFCQQQELSIQEVNSNFYRIEFQGKRCRFESLITTDDEENILIVHTVLPLRADPVHYARIADLVCLINSRLSFSTFEISKKTGIIACRSGIRIGTSDVTNDTIKHTIFRNWMDTEVFFSAFTAVLFSNGDAEQAVITAIDDFENEFRSKQVPATLSIRRNSFN